VYNVTLRSVRKTTVALEKQLISDTECAFVALFIQHAKRMRRIILSSVACPVVQFISSLSDKRQNFRKIFIYHKMRLEILV
jgi:hypothetical protein